MGNSLDDVFGTHGSDDQGAGQGESREQSAGAGQEQRGEQQPPQGGEGEQQQPAGGEQGGEQGAAPPAAGASGRMVPVEALEATRNDWKAKATEAQTEARLLRERLERYERSQQPQGQPGGQQQQVDPVQAQYQRLENVVLNASERAARRDHGTETVDKAWARVQQEFGANPSLYDQIVRSPDPWDQVVQHGKRLMAMDEIGNDPAAYRKKLEEEIRASVLASAGGQQQTNQPAPRIPASLAGERSAGARGNTWTGPTPLEDIFPN